MKKYILVLVLIITCSLLLMKSLGIEHIQDTNCFRFHVPVYAEVFSESNSATNIVAKLQPNDVIIFCGEKK